MYAVTFSGSTASHRLRQFEVDEDNRVNFLFLQLTSEDIEEELSVDDVVDEIDRVSE
jgi:hypothetical protein